LEASPYPVEVAIGFNSNFNMSAPGPGRWDEALSKVPYYVHIAPFASEMAQYADIILPASTFLEQWGYDHSPPGSGFAEAKIKQPVVESVGDSRAVGNIVFELARRLEGTVASSFTGIGNDTEGFVRYRTGTLTAWKEFYEKGVWVGPDYKYGKYDSIFQTPSKKFEFRSGNLEMRLKQVGRDGNGLTTLPHYDSVEFLGNEKDYPLVLLTYQPLLDIENGSQNYPWAQQIFLVRHGIGWENVVEVYVETASALGFGDGNMVWVESPFNRIKARARVFEGVYPGVVAISRGQGHYAYGRWAKGIGVNPNEIVGVDYDHLSGQAAFFNTRVRVYKA
jgi:anaerobic selenocysteine-containing dehydrogenase